MSYIILVVLLVVIVFIILNQNKKSKTNVKLQNQNQSDASSENETELVINNDLPQSDFNDNYWIPVESKKREVKINLYIKYKNSRSIISERQFDLYSFSRGEQGYHLHGYCHKKDRIITLSSLGVLEAKEVSTNENIPNIIEYIEKRYKETINYKQDLLFEEYGWAIYILLYLSASSGSVIKKERDIILFFIKSIKGFEELSEEWIDETIKDLYRPGKMEIRNWIKERIKKSHNFDLLFPWIDKLEGLQSENNKEFQNLKKYILKQISEINNA